MPMTDFATNAVAGWTPPSKMEAYMAPGGPVEISGILKNATMEFAFGKYFLCGDIHDDQTGRYVNGRRIHTSFIRRDIAPMIFEVRSGHVYRVENWIYPPFAQGDLGDENDHNGAR